MRQDYFFLSFQVQKMMSLFKILIIPMIANGRRYEIVGDCGLLSCPVTPNLMRRRMLA